MLAALDQAPGAIPALPLRDTVKRGAGETVVATLDRADLWRALTPQGFDFQAILAAHRAVAGEDLPDDAAVAEHAGFAVRLVAGSEENFKVTEPDDFARAERLLACGAGRVPHRPRLRRACLRAGRSCLAVRRESAASTRGLVGHSDADVGLHAITDAILGALGERRYRHAFSARAIRNGATPPRSCFLRHAADLVAERRGGIVHVDLTLICEHPRIGPHRAAMVARIAEILGSPNPASASRPRPPSSSALPGAAKVSRRRRLRRCGCRSDDRRSTVIATWFGCGWLPWAPGSWGSLAALPFAWLVARYGGTPGAGRGGASGLRRGLVGQRCVARRPN